MIMHLNDRLLPWSKILWLVTVIVWLLIGSAIYDSYETAWGEQIVLGEVTTQIDAPPGGHASFVILADRTASLRNGCRVDILTWVYDSSSRPEPYYLGALPLSHEQLQDREVWSPGAVPMSVAIPERAASGSGFIVAEFQHFCSVWHAIFGPRKTRYRRAIEILPRAEHF